MGMMNHEQIKERLQVMRCQEDSIYSCSDYLQDQPALPQSPNDTETIDQLCRFKMTEWCYTVIDYIKFRRETVAIAMSYLDRFLCSRSPRATQVMNSRKEYQLASMTTLFMAIKINEPIMVDITLMTELSKGVYTNNDFKKMETDILFGLNWFVNGPTANSFAVHLLTLMQDQHQEELRSSTKMNISSIDYNKLLQRSNYTIELSVGEYSLMTEKPSVIAAAAIGSCIEGLYPASSSQQSKSLYLQLDIMSVTDAKQSLNKLQNNAPIQMRPTSSESLIQVAHSPRSTASSPTYSATQTNQYVSMQKSCTQDDAEHCSPICISKRKTYP